MRETLADLLGFPEERDLAGQMVLAYGEIEFKLMVLMGHALSSNTDLAAKVLYRVRGESARIDVADALIRPAYYRVGLGPKWENCFGAIKKCKRFRNQYAHCHWFNFNSKLALIDFDADVRSANDDVTLQQLEVDVDLLQLQAEYFAYTLDFLSHLEGEYERRTGLTTSNTMPEPKSLTPPPPYTKSTKPVSTE
ncbi:hypothetical protein IC762_15365 [Bradyrhizobium genosp. L]|uniref:hypothetical protein n=1 Tax=Bradyrhizobium genosp. L TaxID=83637 RepID=UPI0018A293C0|nr:hypothetical protein [Bradyrhizobium genosp. L]QPF87579.1 hypothetical protein IC762_15365 [Bradyrhizobium genosp. L]